jgi:integrase
MARNPMLGFKLLPEDNVRDRVLNEEEFQRLLFSAPNHLQPVLITAWETGMRRNEILGLCWDQVDLRRDVIHLSGEQTKTGRNRNVPISPTLKKTLSRIKREGDHVFIFKGRGLKDIRTGFALACRKAGIEGLWFHDLRHCFVTRMRRKGVPDRVIMAITGHQTFECFRRYDSITEGDLKAAVQ